MMDQYIVSFKVSGASVSEYYSVDSLEAACKLIGDLVDEAEAWHDNWESKIFPAHHFDY